MGTSGRAITSMPPGYHSTCVYDTYVPLVYFQYLRSLLGVTAQPLCITTIVGLQGGEVSVPNAFVLENVDATMIAQ